MRCVLKIRRYRINTALRLRFFHYYVARVAHNAGRAQSRKADRVFNRPVYFQKSLIASRKKDVVIHTKTCMKKSTKCCVLMAFDYTQEKIHLGHCVIFNHFSSISWMKQIQQSWKKPGLWKIDQHFYLEIQYQKCRRDPGCSHSTESALAQPTLLRMENGHFANLDHDDNSLSLGR